MGALIERVLEYRVCAIVVMNGTPPSRIVKECLSNGVPVILVNKPMPGFAVDTVVTDHAGRRPRRRRSASRRRMPAARGRVERCADREPRRTPRRVPQAGGEGGCAGARLAGRAHRLFDRARRRAGDARRRCDRWRVLRYRSARARLSRRRSPRSRPARAGRPLGDRLRRHSAGRLECLSAHDVPAAGPAADRCRDAGHTATRKETGDHRMRTVTLPATLVVRNTVRGLAAHDEPMKPQVVAHRGSSDAHADNSWAAFEAAVAEGADAIECDVQSTRDGVLVIRHDLAIVGNRLVAECSAAEIEATEPGLVRLADLLAWAQRAKIGLLVEIKDPDLRDARSATWSPSSRVARANRRRRLPWTGAGGGQGASAANPDVADDRQRGRAGGPGPARRGLPRGRRASVLGSTGRRSRIGCSTRRRSQSCGRPVSRSRSGTRSARANCGRWSRFGPMPSAPTRPRCCDVSWTASNCHGSRIGRRMLASQFHRRGERPCPTRRHHHELETRTIWNGRRCVVRAPSSHRHAAEDVVIKVWSRADRSGPVARRQSRHRGRHAQQDARGRRHRQARQDRAQRDERQGL